MFKSSYKIQQTKNNKKIHARITRDEYFRILQRVRSLRFLARDWLSVRRLVTGVRGRIH